MKLSITVISILISISSMAQEAKEIVAKADEKIRGKSNRSETTMSIIRPSWQRTITFKSWSKGKDYSLTLITSPAKEKGQTYLKRLNEIWNWNPIINRMIKLPPSMMSQSLMGSDYTNDDMLKESSIVVDYEHKILIKEELQGKECYKILMIPLKNATVVWGKVIKWITVDDFLQLKTEYYDENSNLVKTEIASNIKKMGDRVIPTHVEYIPNDADKKGYKTIIEMNAIEFGISIDDNFFSQQNMKIIR